MLRRGGPHIREEHCGGQGSGAGDDALLLKVACFRGAAVLKLIRDLLGRISRRAERLAEERVVQLNVSGSSLELRRVKPPLDERVELSGVTRLAMYKVDELTTDLICCRISQADRTDIIIHEDMLGFDEAMALFATLPGFRADWREVVVKPPFAENYTVVFERA